MSGGKVSTAAKPIMRGLLHSQIKKNLGIALVSAAIAGVAFTQFYRNPRKKMYVDFYKTYDPEAHYNRMRDAGLMQAEASASES